MSDTTEFPYVVVRNSLGEVGLRPLLPVTLSHRGIAQEAVALLDTGADVNVLPYNLGIQLGGVWDQARSGLKLSGNLSQLEARGIIISCIVGTLPPVQLAFAWTRSETVPLLFGQVNFFAEFDVCFFRAIQKFEIRPKSR